MSRLSAAYKLNGLNPSEWLKDTLEKLPTWPNSRIDELLPFAVASVQALNHRMEIKDRR